MDPAAVCAEMLKSGLRGRGGGGFPTGRKWELTRVQPGPKKYVICNGDEGDPGAFMDRSVMQNGRGSAHICTACPAAVNFIERHRPDLAENLLPVASPMIMHARHIRALLGAETKVVYIGPCSARKAEAQRPANAGLVDAVLTFRELRVWLGKRKIDLANCEESDFDDTPNGNARLIPLAGGLPDTSGPADGLSPLELLTVTGPHGVKKALDAVKDGMREAAQKQRQQLKQKQQKERQELRQKQRRERARLLMERRKHQGKKYNSK